MTPAQELRQRAEIVIRTQLGIEPTAAGIVQALVDARLLVTEYRTEPTAPDAARAVTVWRAEVAGIPLGLYLSAAEARAHCADRYRQKIGQAPTLTWYEDDTADPDAPVLLLYAAHDGIEVETSYRVVQLTARAEYDPDGGDQ